MSNTFQAIEAFRQARRHARFEQFVARLAGESNDLLPYEEVRQLLRAQQQLPRGLQTISLDAIVGSVGRYRDFTRTFLPKIDADASRWAQVKVAQEKIGLPPIEVYQLSDVYFVLDGNHRVSIARQLGNTTIEAYVTEVYTSISLSADTTLDNLILQAEYANFLHITKLDKYRPHADLHLTSPGHYDVLIDHISVHRYFMGLNQHRPINEVEAVKHWYDTVYQPTVQMIDEQGLLNGFPTRTASDLYVWLAQHRAEIEAAVGWTISTPDAVSALAAMLEPESTGLLAPLRELALPSTFAPQPQQHDWWIKHRIASAETNLFLTLLVPLLPTDTGFYALEYAIMWAMAEQSQLIGVHAVKHTSEQHGLITQMVQAEFDRQLATSAVNGLFKTEVGTHADLVPDLARWVDFTLLAQPAANAQLHTWNIIRSTRGLLLLVPPRPIQPLRQILLVYDQSPYAQEALLVADYIQRRRQLPLTILMTDQTSFEDIETAHLLTATVINVSELSADTILNATESNLIILGGYTTTRPQRQRRKLLDTLIEQATSSSLLLCR